MLWWMVTLSYSVCPLCFSGNCRFDVRIPGRNDVQGYSNQSASQACSRNRPLRQQSAPHELRWTNWCRAIQVYTASIEDANVYSHARGRPNSICEGEQAMGKHARWSLEQIDFSKLQCDARVHLAIKASIWAKLEGYSSGRNSRPMFQRGIWVFRGFQKDSQQSFGRSGKI